MSAADLTCPVHADRGTFSIVAIEELPPDFASCVHCVETLRALRELRALGDSLPWTSPHADRSATVRARVVGSLSPRLGSAPRPLRRRIGPAAIGVAAVFSAMVVAFVAARREKGAASGSVRTDASLAVIRQVGPARFKHTSQAPNEVVRLEQGQVHLSVAHLAPAQRFRVVTADAVVEVRGTEFDVQASHDHLQAVAVQRGLVEVRVGASEPALLTEGARWSAGQSPATPPSVPVPVPAPARVAHATEVAVHRKEGTPAHAAAAASESAAAERPLSPALPLAPPSPHEQIPAPGEVNLPATPAKPVLVAAPKPPEVVGTESKRREREEQRSERREQRDERRLEHLERRR